MIEILMLIATWCGTAVPTGYRYPNSVQSCRNEALKCISKYKMEKSISKCIMKVEYE